MRSTANSTFTVLFSPSIVASVRSAISNLAKHTRKAKPTMTPEFEALVASVTEQATHLSNLTTQIDRLVAVWNAPEPSADQIVSVTQQIAANTTAIIAAKDRLQALLDN